VVYFALLFVIVVLGSLALSEWISTHRPSKLTLGKRHRRTQQRIAAGDWEGAKSEIDPLLKWGHRDSTTCRLQAHILRGHRQLAEALDVIQSGIDKHSTDLLLRQEKGRILLELGRSAEALTELTAAQPVLANEDDIVDLAAALYNTDNINDAWQTLKDHALESCNGRLLALAGDCQFHWSNYALAIDFYQQAHHYGWSNQRTLARTGHSLQRTGAIREAERYFRAILEKDSTDLTATLGLGSCFEAKGMYQRALLVYQSGSAWDAAHPSLLHQAGICAVHTKQYEHAKIYLEAAIDQGSNSPQAFVFLGYALESLDKWPEAEEIYQKLVQLHPDHPAGYRALAWLFGVGRSVTTTQERGLAIARRSLSLLNDDTAWELLSACEARAGNFNRAHHIQEHLSAQAADRVTQARRRKAMRSLRKRIPLDQQHIARSMVA
jgi:tetratricopeptide (TPR) repeat protein